MRRIAKWGKVKPNIQKKLIYILSRNRYCYIQNLFEFFCLFIKVFKLSLVTEM